MDLLEQSLEVAKDTLHEMIIDDNQSLARMLHPDARLLNIIHISLREYNKVTEIIIDTLMNYKMNSDSMMIRQYFHYLQKIGTILDIYSRVHSNSCDLFESMQVRVITLHKLQNIVNVGLVLIQLYQPKLAQVQVLVYEDIMAFNNFIKAELNQVIETYSTYSTSVTISLYQIYNDMRQQDAELIDFQRNSPLKLPIPEKYEISEILLSDFINFTGNLTLMSTRKNMKPLNIPTKDLPCGGKEAQVLRQYRKFHSMQTELNL